MTREEEIKKVAEKKAHEPSKLMHPYAKQNKTMSAYEIGFIEGAVWADSHRHWISVEDELPKDSERVLCVTATGWVYVDFYSRTTYGNIWFQTERNPTHWMPLPKFPKK